MKKMFQYLVIGLIALLVLVYTGVKYSNIVVGEKAPDFETTLIDGTRFRLSNLEGKYVLLDFWGSWCPPCRIENPQLVRLHSKYSDKLIIVTVALEKDNVSWKKVVEKDGFTWKNQIVNQNRYVILSPVARKYGVTSIPAKFLISPNGKLLGSPSFDEIDQMFSKEN